MSITAEAREHFENLIKPLVTNQSLEELLWKFKERIFFKIRWKIERAKFKDTLKVFGVFKNKQQKWIK